MAGATPSRLKAGQLAGLFRRQVLARPVAAFIVMGVAFVAFGLSSLNLLHLLRANAAFLVANGWMAVMDGGLEQLAGLLFNGYLALAAYAVFKSCEHALVERICRGAAPAAAHVSDSPAKEPTP